MFSYQQIARWLTFPLDPISVEDWVANREIFGPTKKASVEEQELELAYQIEQAKQKQLGELPPEKTDVRVLVNGFEVAGLFEGGDFLVVAPVGSVHEDTKSAGKVWVYGEKVEEIDLPAGQTLVVTVDPQRPAKIKVKLSSGLTIDGKNQAEWTGSGKQRVLFDVRGRPLPDYGVGKEQQERMRQLRRMME